MRKKPSWVRWYICGEYHCDHCPYSWEERGEEDADAGCYLFGELRETCRLIRNPISRMIVNARMNDADGRYDFWTEVSNDIEIAEEIQKGLEKEAKDLEHYFPAKKFVSSLNGYDQYEIIKTICAEYNLMKYPYQTPWKKLKSAFAEWWKYFTYRHFKRYFRRKL